MDRRTALRLIGIGVPGLLCSFSTSSSAKRDSPKPVSFEEALKDPSKREQHIEQTIQSFSDFSGDHPLPVIDRKRILLVKYVQGKQDKLDFIGKYADQTQDHFGKLITENREMVVFSVVRGNDGLYKVAHPKRGEPRHSALFVSDRAYDAAVGEEYFRSVLMHELTHTDQIWGGQLHFTRNLSLYDVLELRCRYDTRERLRELVTELDAMYVQAEFESRSGTSEYLIKRSMVAIKRYAGELQGVVHDVKGGVSHPSSRATLDRLVGETSTLL